MPLLQFNDLNFPEWLQGASWEVRTDITDGSGEFGLRLNTERSGRRRMLADVSIRLIGQQLMAFESFCVNDLNNCKDKFLANYPDGSGLTNGVVKFVDGYTVNTDGRTHVVNFTLELPSLPNKPALEPVCIGTFTSDSYWTSSDFTFVTDHWESSNTDAEKQLDIIGATTAFKPETTALTIEAGSDAPYTVDVFWWADNPVLSAQQIIGSAQISVDANSTAYTVATMLKWPTGVNADDWVFDRLVFILSTGYTNFDVNCIDFA